MAGQGSRVHHGLACAVGFTVGAWPDPAVGDFAAGVGDETAIGVLVATTRGVGDAGSGVLVARTRGVGDALGAAAAGVGEAAATVAVAVGLGVGVADVEVAIAVAEATTTAVGCAADA